MKKIINKAFSNVFFQGGIFYTATNFINIFLNYLFNIFAARQLGPGDFGEISAFFSYVIILTTPISIVSSFLIIKIGKSNDPYSYSASILHWFGQKIKNWWYSFIPVLIIIPFLPQLTNLSPFTAYILIPTAVSIYIMVIYEGIIQALHLFIMYAILGTLFTLIKLVGPLLILVIPPNLQVVMTFIFLAFVIKLLLDIYLLQKKLIGTKLTKISQNFTKVLKDQYLIVTLVSTVSLALVTNIDIIFVKKFFTAENAGIYASWTLFSKVIVTVLGPLVSLGFIFFSSKKHEMRHQMFFIFTFIVLAIVGFVSMMVYGLYGRLFIDLFLGPKFYPVVPFIEWASIHGTAYVMMNFMNSYYLAKGSKITYVLAAGLLIYITALFIFGRDIADVIMINIWFLFGMVAIYLLFFFKDRFISLWKD